MLGTIGIDLGGSSTKIGVVSGGVLVAQTVVPTVESPDAIAVLTPIATAVDGLRSAATAQGITSRAVGCGVPGSLDAERAVVRLNNIHALDGFALRAWLNRRFQLPAIVDNDTCMAAIAEAAAAGSDERRTLVVTVGSGIGAALVVHGDVVRVAFGTTGEAGHILVAPDSVERCPLGCLGCLETVASARAIEQAARRAAEENTSPALRAVLDAEGTVGGSHVAAAAAAGDGVARAIIQTAGSWLGIGMASWAALYEPTHIVLGGGVANAGEEWLARAVATMRQRGVPAYTEHVHVQTARYGAAAGLIGAALMALRAGAG